MKIKPKVGLIIRDPESFEQLAAEGEEKPEIAYWLNHLKAGDVELVSDNANAASKTKTTKEDA